MSEAESPPEQTPAPPLPETEISSAEGMSAEVLGVEEPSLPALTPLPEGSPVDVSEAERPPQPPPAQPPPAAEISSAEGTSAEPEQTEVQDASAPSEEDPPSPIQRFPLSSTGVSGSPLPERVRLARLQPLTLPPFPRVRRTNVSKQELEARVKAVMVEAAETGMLTGQSPVDLAAVASDRGATMNERMDLSRKVGGLRESPLDDGKRTWPTASGDELVAAHVQLRELDKMPLPPLNRQPERRVGGPKGKEVRPEDVAYDIHAVSGLRHLSERDGRPVLPGASSYNPRDRKASALHDIAKAEVGMIDWLVGFVNCILEREMAWEDEVRQQSLAEGKASAENEWFLRSLKLESEVARYRDKACKADTVANAAVRERDAKAHDAALAKEKAEAAVQERLDQLQRRAEQAENWARQAESTRDEALAKATLVGKQLETADTRIKSLEAEALTNDRKITALEQEISRLGKTEAELAAKAGGLLESLNTAKTATQAAETAAFEEKVRADEAERRLAESLQRTRDAEAELAKARSESGERISVDAVAALERDALELQRTMEERAAAHNAQIAEAERAKAALSSQVDDLQRSLEQLKAKSEAEAKAARLREVRSNVDYFNAAVEEIQAEFPHLPLSKFFVSRP